MLFYNYDELGGSVQIGGTRGASGSWSYDFKKFSNPFVSMKLPDIISHEGVGRGLRARLLSVTISSSSTIAMSMPALK